MPRERNILLEGVLRQLGWSQATTARHLQRVAAEVGADDLKAVSASHVNQWVRGSHPEPCGDPYLVRSVVARAEQPRDPSGRHGSRHRA